jgi:dihydroorotase
MHREKEFLPIYESLAINFPKLKIMMEHISSKESIDLLKNYNNLYATLTVHHLLLTLDDVAGGMLNPHAHPKVMFGSNSAPHQKENKECHDGSAGVFTAPIALQALAQLFEENGQLENLNKFVSLNAQKIYNLKPSNKTIKLIKKEVVVPLFANKILK